LIFVSELWYRYYQIEEEKNSRKLEKKFQFISVFRVQNPDPGPHEDKTLDTDPDPH